MLHLLRTRFGVALADAVGKVQLIDGRQARSADSHVPSMMANGNELIHRLTRRIEELVQPTAAQRRGVGRRDGDVFAHARASGARSDRARPLALVQSVRLNRARQLIESSRMTIAQVAESVVTTTTRRRCGA